MSDYSNESNIYIELESFSGSDSISSSDLLASDDSPSNDHKDKTNDLIADEVTDYIPNKIFLCHKNNNYDCDIDSHNISSSEENIEGSSEKDNSEDPPKSKYDHIFSNILLIQLYLDKNKITEYISINKMLVLAYSYIFCFCGLYLLTIHKNLITYIDIYKYMELKNLLFLIGPLVGLGAFLAGTASINNVYFRPDSEGKNVFTIDSLKEFIVSPFQVGTPKFNILWGNTPGVDWKTRLRMLQLNWVAMVGLGAAFSVGILMLL